jgi:hydroxypyruvate isomerase
MRANLEQALSRAASIAEKAGFTLLLEPLNTHVDHAGYYLDSSAEAAELVRGVASPNLKLLYDIYHMQIMEGNLISTIQRHLDIIGHFHAAGVPGRAELDGGEIDYPRILQFLARSGYRGGFGLEYSPALADHGQSLRAMRGLWTPDAA